MKNPKMDEKQVEFVNSLQVITYDLVCFSHLRWDFVFQRPQQLMVRAAQNRRVFYIEEPKVDDGPSRMTISRDPSGVVVAVPHLAKALDKLEGRATHKALIENFLLENQVIQYVAWYYTPMAMGYTDQLKPVAIVYDCMDELAAFNGAPEKMKNYEAQLLKIADVVFTGGYSLYESKRESHPNIHPFPSSIDMHHFSQARQMLPDPVDQAHIPHPRLGFFGVIDERMDYALITQVADSHPEWHLVLVGPFAKVDPEKLPHRDNIHYLGMKPYKDLPAYLSGWDAALLPFAINRSTRFISPTKTPEYLAGGVPVVSTPIRDVVRPYGELGLVSIGSTPAEFIHLIEKTLSQNDSRARWLKQVDELLAQNSWDITLSTMVKHIDSTVERNLESYSLNLSNTGTSLSMENLGLMTNQPANHHAHHGNGHAKEFDFLIVGAGFAGSILAERLASGSGKKVLLIDRRPHIAGNAYDHYDEAGLLVHKFGPHIFHTNSREVYAYLSQFTAWRPYEHRVRASVDGQLVPMPINLDTINTLFGTQMSSMELDKFLESLAEPRDQIKTSEDVVVSKVGRQLYEKFFRNYTRKQWGLDPSELDASVTSRVPIRSNRDDRYFTDTYQSMPLHGYTRMFENIIDHPNIRVMLNTDYRDVQGYVSFKSLIFTGPIDEYFDFRFGRLPYRSLQFKFDTYDQPQVQPVAVVNYPNEHLYTRSTEFKHLTGQEHPKTSVVFEYPCSEGDPYYPIPRPENAELFKKYRELAENITNVHFCGRLGTYKYYNMDQVSAQALTLYAKITGVKRTEASMVYTSSQFNIEMPCSLLIQDVE